MEAFDIRREAEQMVEKFHIFDKEWQEELVGQYQEILEQRAGIKRLVFRKTKAQHLSLFITS